MVRTASAAAVLLFAAGLASGAGAQSPQPPESAVAVPIAATPASAAPAVPSIDEAMHAQAEADAPPPPPPPPPPTAAPSVAVAAEPLAAAKPLKFAFAPPPAKATVAASVPAPASAPVAVKAAAPIVVAAAASAPPAAVAAIPQATPAVVKVSAPAPAPRAGAAAPGPGANAFVAHRITDAAGAFDAWTEKAARIDGKFADAAGVAGALTDASAIQTEQLEEGAVAFGALAALQDPVFVQSAKELAALGPDHDAAAAILLNTPAEVMTLQGADGAATFAAQALSKRALAVTEAGKAVRKAAYSMQVDPWARAQTATPEKRLADAKARASAAVALDGDASTLLMKRLVELRTSRQNISVAPGAAQPTPLVVRSLALAAMIVLGEADEAHAAKLGPLLIEAKSTDCLKMARLNFFQCLSVAGPHYEDAFCIGQHGLGEPAQCLVAATGAVVATPAAAPPVLIAAAGPAPSAGVSVPIALLAEDGPERTTAFAARPVAPAAAPIASSAMIAAAEPVAPAPAASASVQLAEAAPAPAQRSADQPTWAREPAPPAAPAYAQAQPRAYARQESPEPRYDRSRAYLWDRQTRSADYAVPGYGPAPYAAYADPRSRYGRYPTQPSRPAYDPRYDDEEDAPAPAPAYQQRGYWNDR